MPRAASLGDRIRASRLNRRLTLGQVAEQVGVRVGALSQLDRDQSTPPIATLKAIATTLDTTIGSLVAETSPLDRAVVRGAERKRLPPCPRISYHLRTAHLSGHVELIRSEYEVGAGTGEEAFAYHAEQCGVVLQGVAGGPPGGARHPPGGRARH